MYRHLFLLLLLISLTNYAWGQSGKKDIITLEEKIGQMLLVGFRGTKVADTNHIVRDIEKYNLGGVILFDYDVPTKTYKRNIHSPAQLKQLIQELKQIANQPLFISVDQEGGKVARLKAERGFPGTVSSQYLGSLNNADSTRFYAKQMAMTLSQMGFNMNFAPVADLNVNPDNPIIGKLERSFSAEPEAVIKHASIFSKTFRSHGIVPVLKHFPGHGSSRDDSHLGVVDVTDTWSKEELIPYEKLIQKNQADVIMTAHIFNAKIDSSYPATLSKPTITGLLRDKLGFDGIVITDDLMMGAIRNEYGLKTTINKALNAGVDILAFANNSVYDPDIIPKAHIIIKELIKEGKISRNQIDESYKRITNLKQKLNR